MLLRTHYPHWSTYAALTRYTTAFGPGYKFTERLVSDGDADFPIRSAAVRKPLRALTALGGVHYYRLSDLAAEIESLRHMARGRIDVLHYLDGEHGALIAPALARLIPRRTRTLATFHQPPGLLPSIISPRVVRHLDMVMVVAPNQVSWFERLVGSDRVRCILHPANTEFFRPPAQRPILPPFRCITVGHWLRDWNAIAAVARAMENRPDFHFDLVTSRETGCESLGNVTIHRNIGDESLLELYQRASALLLPVTDATANNALLEGIACGLPVVTSDIEAMRAYLPSGEGILVRDNDPDELVDALLGLARDENRRNEMGARARRQAESLSWSRMVVEFERLYRDVLA